MLFLKKFKGDKMNKDSLIKLVGKIGLGVILVQGSAYAQPSVTSTSPSAVSTPVPNSKTPTQIVNPVHVSNNQAQSAQVDQKAWAAWMIEAAQVAKDYVETLDKGQYAQSWEKGDTLFQQTITQKEWETTLDLARKRLGEVQSRTLKDEKPAIDPHGLPKGSYMVIEYNTSFDKAPNSGELLTLRRGTDGQWKVLTYQVN
ncbi:unnamed protein product [Candidatus Protochlamydia amoebophila UWE25]|uniref:DUF4019 domain-containing protein n=2 Tax=Parachlamydiaceae TaxID=92713 RepID=A0A2P9H9T1_PARUW|nr:unnamed protein product [Candidatus Protochlamydia amoebophila UWE25]